MKERKCFNFIEGGNNVAKKILSIEVGLRYTRICEMTGYKTTPVVYNCVTFPTPQGTFEDGYIRDKGTLGSAIRQKLSEHKIKTSDAVFTVNSTKIANREVYIPFVKENKIKSIVELQANDYFPIDISDYNISYYILGMGEKVKGQERKIKLLLLAAPNNLVQSYYNLASAAGLNVEAIDYIGNSYYQIVKRQLNQGVNISIHINENTSLINIIENETLLLQRIIPYGANDIVEKVRNNQAFQADTDEAAIRLLEKEKLINFQFELEKEGEEISYMSVSEGLDQARREIRAREEVTASLKFLVNNIIRVLDYFSAKNADKKIGYVYLSGLGSKFQGINHLLKNELGYDTKRIDTIYVANFSKKITIDKKEQADYIACIGAGIAPVNFGVKQKGKFAAKKTDIKQTKNMFAAVAVLSLAFMGTMLFVKIQATTRQNDLKSKIDSLGSVEVIYDTYNETQSKYNNLNGMHEKTLSKVDHLDKILADIEKKLPKKLNVASLEMDQESITFDIEGSGVLALSKLLINLRDIPYLTNLSIDSYESTSSEGDSGIPTITFKIKADFNGTDIDADLNNDKNEADANTEENSETTQD